MWFASLRSAFWSFLLFFLWEGRRNYLETRTGGGREEACNTIVNLGRVDISHPTGHYIRKKLSPPPWENPGCAPGDRPVLTVLTESSESTYIQISNRFDFFVSISSSNMFQPSFHALLTGKYPPCYPSQCRKSNTEPWHLNSKLILRWNFQIIPLSWH